MSDTLDSARLSRREAIALALAHNPQLEIARAQIGEARARKVEAVSIPDPAVTASLDQQRGFFRSGSAGQKNVGVGLDVPFPNKLRLQGKIAQSDVQSAEFTYQLQRQLVAAQTAEAYDSLLVALKHRADLTEAETLARDFLRKTEARFNAGTAAKLDVIKATVDVAQASTQLLANTLDVQNAGSALDRLLGRPIDVAIVPTDSLVVPDSLPSLDRLVAVGLTARPELASIAAQREGARAATALAKQFWLPDLTLSVSRDYNQPNPALFSTGLAFPLPIFFWQHTRGQIAETSFRERELAASERDLRAAVTQGPPELLRERAYRPPASGIHSRPAAPFRTCCLSRRICELYPRRFVGARSARRAPDIARCRKPVRRRARRGEHLASRVGARGKCSARHHPIKVSQCETIF